MRAEQRRRLPEAAQPLPAGLTLHTEVGHRAGTEKPREAGPDLPHGSPCDGAARQSRDRVPAQANTACTSPSPARAAPAGQAGPAPEATHRQELVLSWKTLVLIFVRVPYRKASSRDESVTRGVGSRDVCPSLSLSRQSAAQGSRWRDDGTVPSVHGGHLSVPRVPRLLALRF